VNREIGQPQLDENGQRARPPRSEYHQINDEQQRNRTGYDPLRATTQFLTAAI